MLEYGQSNRFIEKLVFDRVVMDVIDVAPVIALVANPMFPKPPLPDAVFAFVSVACIWRENAALTNAQRVEKSQSSTGSDQMLWR